MTITPDAADQAVTGRASIEEASPELRFADACTKVTADRQREGIGTLGEKTLHAVLKHYYEPDPRYHEQKIGRYFADIAHGNRIIEIQTSSFERLKDKIAAFIDDGYEVTVVHPMPREKRLAWIGEDGTISKPHKSPKKGQPWQAAGEFYNLRHLIGHPQLTLCLLFCDMEEYRNLDGWSKNKKRGSSRYERFPVRYAEEIFFRNPFDWVVMIPDELGERFTRQEYAAATKLGGRALYGALTLLVQVGVIEKEGMDGKRIVYRRV